MMISEGLPTHLSVGGRKIGPGQPTFVIAELSANHHQAYTEAEALVDAAIAAGVDAVKLQTYRPDTITIDCDNSFFRIDSGTIWDGRTLYDLYSEAYTPWEWHAPLQARAAAAGIPLFSSPFDHSAVVFLESLKVPLYKVASFEIVDLPLIARIARTGKPMILSTGMATLDEIDEAVRAAVGAGAREVALLQTTSAYPARPDEANLRTIPDMQARFGVPVGLSDHTPGIAVPVAAVALGASIVEKHLTLDRAQGGPDAAFSLEPSEFSEMVDAIRTAEAALGAPDYELTEGERKSRVFRRSLFAVRDIKAGDAFTEDNVRSIRPANGLHPRHYDEVLGGRAARDIERGTPLSWELVDR